MKRLTAAVMATICLVLAAPLWAQTPARRLMRGDLSGTIATASVKKTTEFVSYDNWHQQAAFGLALGWYWSNHVKTEVDAGFITEGSVYSSVPVVLAGDQRLFVSARTRFANQHLGVTQRYQFGDNEWIHPFIGAGFEVVSETGRRREDALFAFDQAARQTRLVRDAVEFDETRKLRARALLSTGIKAYVTRRAFFLTELRGSLHPHAPEVHWRIGAGVDF